MPYERGFRPNKAEGQFVKFLTRIINTKMNLNIVF